MPRTLAITSTVLLVLALAVGLGGASARSLDTSTTVVVEVIGLGQVADPNNDLSCGDGDTRCLKAYFQSGTVVLTADPADGWTFSGWGGTGCAPSGSTCTVTLDGSKDAHEIVATFSTSPAPNEQALTVNVTPAQGDGGAVADLAGVYVQCGSGGANCSTSVPTGSVLTLRETPDENFDFDGWDGPCAGKQTYCIVRLDADKTLGAAFVPTPTNATLKVSVTGNGTVTGDHGVACTPAGESSCTVIVPKQTVVTLTAT